ncbi:hypothetical protein [Flavobacterium acetivorans]|uniref:hypothetical protein n=1 Tax=Flavobacterium acetivorans TaxID=2893883 RepID=UPI001E586A61|nr:hypothetical protein [Flavobacterium sp. F-29]UFH36064.1 hypothetical protein LNP19_03245 [Flavobacterium sp. F-29]
MNDFEDFLQNKVATLKVRREREENEELNEIELFRLVLMEISYGELFVVLKDFPNADINPIIEKSIYIEARIRQYSSDDALIEMKRQMENRSK